jgi:uncharacterized protein YjbI with pentapeptide repeats
MKNDDIEKVRKMGGKIKSNKLLSERWKKDAIWRHRWECIIQWLYSTSANEDIDATIEMEYTADGYLDMRGFPFYNGINFAEYTDKYKDMIQEIQESRWIISNKSFKNVDFSLSDFTQRYMNKCEFINCIFDNVIMRGIMEEQCSFSDCIFRKGIYGGSLGLGESIYSNVQFQNVKIHGTQMWWPDFENCTFDNCHLRGTDFGGAHFKNVKFIGKVDMVWFRGKMPDRLRKRSRWEDNVRWEQVLPMEVDFSEAILSDLTISDSCDLSDVVWPNDGSCYFIPDLYCVINDIEERLKKEKKRLLERLLEYHLMEQENQKMGVLNLNDVYKEIQKDFAPEEQQESYDLCKEICNDLLSKGIMYVTNTL